MILIEYRKKNSCITYYEPCLTEVFTSAMWSLAHAIYSLKIYSFLLGSISQCAAVTSLHLLLRRSLF